MSEIVIAYDVLRVINAKPLFAKDHFVRLKNSALSVDSGIKFNEKTFLSKIFEEINSNKIINGNIKTQIFIDKQNKSYTVESKQIPHHYPEISDYLNGVNTMTYKFTRKDPNN
ncbi:MAG TPA: aminotransferase class IV, partial [Bacteroidales bacterium]|nr:aminotransferase class IV [Bacteroidales bacterium]